EWLCLRDGVPCPSWVLEPRYHLEHPWFHAFHPDNPDVQARLIRDTPEPFARRNIYSGNRMFANKYEFAGRPNRTL
ncbi:MAG TPA: hypothetical protein VGN32_03755, partial [Ktedonobacterales bacterium]|nr:hypothetical protein [Ktedonobacterales bacterium]